MSESRVKSKKYILKKPRSMKDKGNIYLTKMKSKMKTLSRAETLRDFEIRPASGKMLRRSNSIHSIKMESRNNHQQQSSNTTDSPANNTSTTSSANNNKATMKMKEHKDFDNIHIALAGAKNCGKSALAVRYLTKRFIGEYDSHKDDIWHRSMTVADREVRVSLKDTTGTSWLKTPAPLISWTTAIVVVYSITDRNSFALARHILEIIDKIKPLSSRCTLLIGNKCDLMHLRQVPKSDAKKLADDFGVHFLECSAAENYDDIFSSFTRLLVEAMIAQSAKKHSWDDQNADDVKQNENRLRKRSLSTGQAPSKDSNNNTSFLGGLREKKDSMIKIDERIPSPVEQRDTPAPQRKQSLRRKISGIGSKLVGSGQSNR
ncbi:ras-related and estrogen-regulated growth inhibitor-like isoform X2 [Clytia hemisphaerica]|uniref:small monomeric GTPase n=1 Tax=Clytia hemisphaerica TaxID=252671 RepID=A0A7M5VGH0_9CNID